MILIRTISIFLLAMIMTVAIFCSGKLTEEELFGTAQDHYSKGEYTETVEMYKRLVREFPESQNRPKAIFMIGYVTANHLNNFDEAKAYYTMLVTEYPDHDFVDDAQFELEHLGKDPGDLDKILQDRIKQADSSKKKNR